MVPSCNAATSRKYERIQRNNVPSQPTTPHAWHKIMDSLGAGSIIRSGSSEFTPQDVHTRLISRLCKVSASMASTEEETICTCICRSEHRMIWPGGSNMPTAARSALAQAEFSTCPLSCRPQRRGTPRNYTCNNQKKADIQSNMSCTCETAHKTIPDAMNPQGDSSATGMPKNRFKPVEPPVIRGVCIQRSRIQSPPSINATISRHYCLLCT